MKRKKYYALKNYSIKEISKFIYSIVYRFILKIWSKSPFISLKYINIGKKIFKITSFKNIEIEINLIVLGSQKCGTSSLHMFLNSHPDIFMSFPFKEPRYFCSEKRIIEYFSNEIKFDRINIRNRIDLLLNYMIKGYSGQKYIGESSTDYTIGNQAHIDKIPERIKKLASSNIKFIYIIRNPFERIISHYLHLQYNGYTSREFMDEVILNKSLVETSMYYSRINEYLKSFDKSKFIIIDFHKFKEKDNSVPEAIAGFLELDNNFYWANTNVNKSINKSSFTSNELKFDRKWFEETKLIFMNEMILLNNDFELALDWDLDEKKYTV